MSEEIELINFYLFNFDIQLHLFWYYNITTKEKKK